MLTINIFMSRSMADGVTKNTSKLALIDIDCHQRLIWHLYVVYIGMCALSNMAYYMAPFDKAALDAAKLLALTACSQEYQILILAYLDDNASTMLHSATVSDNRTNPLH